MTDTAVTVISDDSDVDGQSTGDTGSQRGKSDERRVSRRKKVGDLPVFCIILIGICFRPVSSTLRVPELQLRLIPLMATNPKPLRVMTNL